MVKPRTRQPARMRQPVSYTPFRVGPVAMSERLPLANALRALAMDGVQQANSGHPGAPMGMADIAEVLWNDALKHNPGNPHWADRDRFVLSNGHGSMLIYGLLHLTGYDLPIEELKRFRQLHSKTPGHPEYSHTVGVETTTGPRGQGLATAAESGDEGEGRGPRPVKRPPTARKVIAVATLTRLRRRGRR